MIVKAPNFNWRRHALTAVLFAVVVLLRFTLISLYADSMPAADAWDAEGATLIKPWLEGRLTIEDLFRPHNEHRVLFTRLLALAVFEAGGRQWDNLVGCYVNILVYALTIVAVFALLQEELGARWQRLALLGGLSLFAALPTGYENSLLSFGSQFYLLIGFAQVALVIAARSEGPVSHIGLILVCACSLFTMASGVLTSVAAAAILVLRLWLRQLRFAQAIPFVLTMLVVAGVGYKFVPIVWGHRMLKAQSLEAWFQAVRVIAAWPTSLGHLGAAIMWLPGLLLFVRVVRLRAATSSELVALGFLFWVGLQACAMAYSRGGTVIERPSPRYTDVLLFGLGTGLHIVIRAVPGWWRPGNQMHSLPSISTMRLRASACTAFGILFVTSLLLGLRAQASADLATLQAGTKNLPAMVSRVRAFVQDDKLAHLSASPTELPYPDVNVLATYLRDPTLRSVLPPTIRAPMDVRGGEANGAFNVVCCAESVSIHSESGPSAQNIGSWRSPLLKTSFSFIEVRSTTSIGRDGRLSLGVVPDDPLAERRVKLLNGGRTAAHFLFVPDGVFRLIATDNSPNRWMAVTAPIETNLLSMLARRAKNVVLRSQLGQWLTASSSDSEDTVSLPFVVEDSRPLLLTQSMTVMHFSAPRGGSIEAVAVQIGNFGGRSDGFLVAELCLATGCIEGVAPLLNSNDNDFLSITLAQPVRVHENQPLELRLSTQETTLQPALWTYSAVSGSACISEPSESSCGARAPFVRLRYLRR